MLRIEPVHERHRQDFLQAAAASVSLHHPWIAPPRTERAFAAHLQRYQQDEHASFIGLTEQGRPVGCVHLNEIVRGALQSAYLAYFVFRPFDGRGLMRELLANVIDHAFHGLQLHRLEANIQPENRRSKALVQALGFRLEGFSPRYLYIDSAWRDHERHALTVEEWKRPGA
ncbi:MAG: GNAT family protein [Salinisphaera sp.]|nr:GNAT family protein [Salinisphaera sp.]